MYSYSERKTNFILQFNSFFLLLRESPLLKRWLFWTKILAASLIVQETYDVPNTLSDLLDWSLLSLKQNFYEALMYYVTVLSDYFIHIVGWETLSCIQHLQLIPSTWGIGTFTTNEWDPDLIPLTLNFFYQYSSTGSNSFLWAVQLHKL